jgi:hypothetical protein
LVAPGFALCKSSEVLGPPSACVLVDFAVVELPELVAQLPLLPLTPDEEFGVFAADELLLQLNAFATFDVIVIGATIIAKTLAVEMARTDRVTLFIHVIALSDV